MVDNTFIEDDNGKDRRRRKFDRDRQYDRDKPAFRREKGDRRRNKRVDYYDEE